MASNGSDAIAAIGWADRLFQGDYINGKVGRSIVINACFCSFLIGFAVSFGQGVGDNARSWGVVFSGQARSDIEKRHNRQASPVHCQFESPS